MNKLDSSELYKYLKCFQNDDIFTHLILFFSIHFIPFASTWNSSGEFETNVIRSIVCTFCTVVGYIQFYLKVWNSINTVKPLFSIYYYYDYPRRTYSVSHVHISDYVNTGRSNSICFYGHFYDIKTFRVDN